MSDDRFYAPQTDAYSFHQSTDDRAPLVDYGPSDRGDWRRSAPCRQIGDVTVCGEIYDRSGRPLSYSESFKALAPMSQEMLYDMCPWMVPPATRTNYRPSTTYDPYNRPGSYSAPGQPQPYYDDARDPYSFHPGAPGRPTTPDRPPTYYEDRDPYSFHPGAPNDRYAPYRAPEQEIPPAPYRPVEPPCPVPPSPVRPVPPEVRPQPSRPVDERPCEPQPCRPCQPTYRYPCRPCNGWYPGKIAGGVVRRVFGGRCR